MIQAVFFSIRSVLFITFPKRFIHASSMSGITSLFVLPPFRGYMVACDRRIIRSLLVGHERIISLD